MLMGMTGFGSAQLSFGKFKVIVEIKSLNNRYFDINTFLPTGFSSIENRIRHIVQEKIDRGRITVSVKVVQKPSQEVALNKDVVKTYLMNAKSLAKEIGIVNDITLAEIIKLPGVIESKELLISPEEIGPQLEKCVTAALGGVLRMRKSEGKSLAADVSEKLKQMISEAKSISLRAKEVLVKKKKALTVDEFKSFQKSCDINEELSRLEHYISEMKELLKGTTAAGKKIDFIAQEMQRETNTIGSKLQDKSVTSSVISLKSKIEKIREQAQNVE